ncbi:MAG: hypothetical protein R6X33_17365 [Candidatus Brocadiia bacterium]
MSFDLRSIAVSTVPMRTRMPFRYGIAKLEALPHIFVKATLEDNASGAVTEGVAAEGLLPKWFEKHPDTTAEQDLANMHRVIVQAGKFALEIGSFEDAFTFWKDIYDAQESWAADRDLEALLWHFGVSLTERAVIDALCRHWGTPFHQAVAENLFGIDIASIHPHIERDAAETVLRQTPLDTIHARHTVGLSDAILAEDVEDQMNDGLPESLEEDIETYGLTYFKIKVRGDVEVDVERLRRIAGLFRSMDVTDYQFTLDGNEQFHDVGTFETFWSNIRSDEELSSFFERLLFVEQPFSRKIALSDELARDLTAWDDAPPMIIDESDGDLEALPRALEGGWAGTSHKNCKGVFKGIINRAYIEDANRKAGRERYFMSGEDLVNIGPVALLQDLAAMAKLGISHVERNGHHYFRGLAMFSDALQEDMLEHHGDLYHRHADGYAALDVQQGRIDVGSLNRAPFGVDIIPQESEYVPIEEWECPPIPDL